MEGQNGVPHVSGTVRMWSAIDDALKKDHKTWKWFAEKLDIPYRTMTTRKVRASEISFGFMCQMLYVFGINVSVSGTVEDERTLSLIKAMEEIYTENIAFLKPKENRAIDLVGPLFSNWDNFDPKLKDALKVLILTVVKSSKKDD